MDGIRHIEWDQVAEGVPAFLTIIVMPLTFSIANGVSMGIISYCAIKVFTGRGKDVHWALYIVAALLLARAAHHARMSVCVDDVRQVDALGAAAESEGSRIGVFVEIDIGQGRCGVPDADGVLRLLERLAAHPQLEFRGLQAYHGGLQHLRAHDARRAQSQRRLVVVGHAASVGVGRRVRSAAGVAVDGAAAARPMPS